MGAKLKVLQSFEVTRNVGALVCADREIDGPRQVTYHYKEGEVLRFSRKADATGFVRGLGALARLVQEVSK